MRARIGLVLFGLALGVAGLAVALSMLPQSLLGGAAQGTTFQSFDDVRRAMLRQEDSSEKSGGAGVESEDDVRGGNLRAIVNPHPNDHILYDVRPNLDTTFQRARLQTNSCGMRDSEISVAKPASRYRIALLGDSFAFGWGVEAHESFASRLENNLNRLRQDETSFEVLNLAVPGYSTFQEVARFLEVGVEFNPDEVLVYFVQNDFGLPFYVRDVYQPGGLTSATEFARLAWKAIDPKIEEQKLELQGLDPNTALRLLSDYCRAQGIRLSIAFNPRSTWKSDMQRLWILKERPEIRVINLRPDLLRIIEQRRIPEEALTLAHDPHPSPLRHAILGDLLTPYFMDVEAQ